MKIIRFFPFIFLATLQCSGLMKSIRDTEHWQYLTQQALAKDPSIGIVRHRVTLIKIQGEKMKYDDSRSQQGLDLTGKAIAETLVKSYPLKKTRYRSDLSLPGEQGTVDLLAVAKGQSAVPKGFDQDILVQLKIEGTATFLRENISEPYTPHTYGKLSYDLRASMLFTDAKTGEPVSTPIYYQLGKATEDIKHITYGAYESAVKAGNVSISFPPQKVYADLAATAKEHTTEFIRQVLSAKPPQTETPRQ